MKTYTKVLIALALAGAGAAAVWLAASRSAPPPPEEEPKARRIRTIAEAKPSAAPAAKAEPVLEDEDGNAAERERRMAEYKAMTPDQRWQLVMERAKKSPLRDRPGTNRIFRTSTEQVMDWIFRCDVGDPPPLLPELPLKERLHLVDILISDNPILEGDSESAKEAKETVALVKKEFQEFIRAGGQPDEFLPYYHGQLVQAHEEWKATRKMVIETVKNEPEIAAEFLAKANEKLAAKGIKKIVLPQKMLDHYGIVVEE